MTFLVLIFAIAITVSQTISLPIKRNSSLLESVNPMLPEECLLIKGINEKEKEKRRYENQQLLRKKVLSITNYVREQVE